MTPHESALHAREDVLRPAGEADLSTAASLLTQITGALDRQPALLVIDLSELSFCDLHGLDAVQAGVGHAEQLGVHVTLLNASRQLSWLISTFPATTCSQPSHTVAAWGSPELPGVTASRQHSAVPVLV